MRHSVSFSTSKSKGSVSVLMDVRKGDDRKVFWMCSCKNKEEAQLAIAFIKVELTAIWQGEREMKSLLRYLDIAQTMSTEGRV